MTDSKSSAPKPGDGDDDLSALRHLLLRPEQRRIEALGERLDNPELRAHDVSRVLPDALRLSAKDNEIGRASCRERVTSPV